LGDWALGRQRLALPGWVSKKNARNKEASMSLIKSLAVGCGDMYYIRHGSDNFTIIDCMLPQDENRAKAIVDELASQSTDKGIVRFISTHPDQDHVSGLQYLDSQLGLKNFYCVKNATTKEDPTSDFEHYCKLRDDQDKAFHLHKGCSRKWMNQADEKRGSAGINVLWPDTSNAEYQTALQEAERGESPNNTSTIIKYSLEDGVTALWMGDLETDFMERIDGQVAIPEVDVLFAPHHGRKSGRVPDSWLKQMNPTMVVIGEADAKDLHYYPGWNTITQNQARDIALDCHPHRVDVFVSSETYSVDFLYDAKKTSTHGRYIGSFNV